MKFFILKQYAKIKSLLDLTEDFDEEGTSEFIRSNTDFKSANAWTLIFAIFVASIGFQVNSTAVIIGAMLISPLMGPIVGAGFALGVQDFELLKKSLYNLTYAVLISILTSCLFFLLSPSGAGPQSELLARTQPTFFDVLIAFFGGAAGIVAVSRKVKSNAIPGVAIATALMPPLCTVGYGLAHLDLTFIIGAFYLFAINSLFICAATYLFVRVLNFKTVFHLDSKKDKEIKKWMGIAAFIFIIPSLVMAWYLHKKTRFESQARTFVTKEFVYPKTFVAQKIIDFKVKRSKITVKIIGEALPEPEISRINEAMYKKYRIKNTDIEIIDVSNEGISINDLEEKFATKAELLKLKDSIDFSQKNLELKLDSKNKVKEMRK